MAKKEIVPLSAVELNEAERLATTILNPLQHKADKARGALATNFLRLLALHRATERQSAMLQSQVRLLESENAKLEAAMERISEGRGRYSRDPLTHAANTIDDMKQTALDALNRKYPEVSHAG